MLAIQNKQLNSIFERIVKDKNGGLFRVRFVVVQINGQYQGRVISAEPILNSEIKSDCVECLPVPKIKSGVTFVYKPTASRDGFYFNPLFFFTSQPTRAPSF